ncbi:MATE family efflux transporter [Lachnoclostridium sp. An169]|nr:MATE family efflux transporter [Lachnoclostridium sp. An169]
MLLQTKLPFKAKVDISSEIILKEKLKVKNEIDFISDDTKKCLLMVALPMMAAMFLNMAYNLVDSLWIGNLMGETAYAALTSSTPIILILNSIAMGATNGVSILLSRAVGAGDRENTESLVATSLVVSAVFSVGITVLLELFLRPLLILLQTPGETFQMACEYLEIYLLGYLAVYLYCYFTAVLRSFGNTVFQVVAMLVCTILNAVLDPLFIHWMGFRGAAAATLLSQMLCLIFMLGYLWKKRLFEFHITAFRIRWIGLLFAKGIPAAFQQSIPAVSTSFLTSLVSGYGVSAIAAYGITGKMETVLVIFARQISGLFVDSRAAAEIVRMYFLIVGAGYILNTVTNCFLGAVNGMGKPAKSLLCMVLYYLLIRMPLAAMFSALGLGLNGIWTAVLISHIVAAVAAALAGNHELGRSDCMP